MVRLVVGILGTYELPAAIYRLFDCRHRVGSPEEEDW